MNHPSELIDELVKKQLRPALKPLGFKANGSTFSRFNGELVEIISVQKSSGNNADEARFTINLGVYWPKVHELLSGSSDISSLKEYDCTLRKRIGTLFDEKKDFWWSVTPHSDVELIGRELLEKIRAFAFPWLTRATSIDEAVRMAHPKQAIAFHLLKGEREQAATLIADQIAINKETQGIYRVLAKRLGLEMPNS